MIGFLRESSHWLVDLWCSVEYEVPPPARTFSSSVSWSAIMNLAADFDVKTKKKKESIKEEITKLGSEEK